MSPNNPPDLASGELCDVQEVVLVLVFHVYFMILKYGGML